MFSRSLFVRSAFSRSVFLGLRVCVFKTPRENKKLLTKLPVWHVSRWNREATRSMKDEKKYRDFKTSPRLDPSPHSLFTRSSFRFLDYLRAWNRLHQCRSRYLLCNPISSFYAVKEVETAVDSVEEMTLVNYQNRKTQPARFFMLPRKQKFVLKSQMKLQRSNCSEYSKST